VVIALGKISNQPHAVTVTRDDGSSQTIELDSRDFLRHDLAHLAFEMEAGLRDGAWGSVARDPERPGDGRAVAMQMMISHGAVEARSHPC
jgi:hypothetical protein